MTTDRFGTAIDPRCGYAWGTVLASHDDEARRALAGRALIRARVSHGRRRRGLQHDGAHPRVSAARGRSAGADLPARLLRSMGRRGGGSRRQARGRRLRAPRGRDPQPRVRGDARRHARARRPGPARAVARARRPVAPVDRQGRGARRRDVRGGHGPRRVRRRARPRGAGAGGDHPDHAAEVPPADGGRQGGLPAGEVARPHRVPRARGFEYGLEAQFGHWVASLRALEQFDIGRVREVARMAHPLLDALRQTFGARAYLAGPGVAVSGEDLVEWALERAGRATTSVVPNEAASAASFAMLREHGLVTIPTIGMPGAAATFRLMVYPDGPRLGLDGYVRAVDAAAAAITEAIGDPEKVRRLIFGGVA